MTPPIVENLAVLKYLNGQKLDLPQPHPNP